jgi:uncharacterized protein (TIGR00369 family)
MTIPADFVACPIPDGRFASMVGPLYWRKGGEVPRFGWRAEADHANDMGGVHGGMLMTLADQVLGLTVMEAVDGAKVVTLSLNCDFVSGARPGQWIEGEAHIIRKTSSLIFVRGILTANDSVVLSAAGIWKRARPRSDSIPQGAHP